MIDLMEAAQSILANEGNCAEADVTCPTCPVREICMAGKLAGKTREKKHENTRKAVEDWIAKKKGA